MGYQQYIEAQIEMELQSISKYWGTTEQENSWSKSVVNNTCVGVGIN